MVSRPPPCCTGDLVAQRRKLDSDGLHDGSCAFEDGALQDAVHITLGATHCSLFILGKAAMKLWIGSVDYLDVGLASL